MDNTKIYTAQEMREAADNFWIGGVICEVKDEQGRVVKQINDDTVIAMLRYAADVVEENAELQRRLTVAEDALTYARNSITRDCYNECDYIRECTSAHGRCKCIVEDKIENALRTKEGDAGKEENEKTK